MKPPFTTSDVCIGLFFAVLLAVGSHCFLGVPAGMNGVGPRGMRMVRRLLVVSTLVMLGRLSMMAGSVCQVLPRPSCGVLQLFSTFVVLVSISATSMLQATDVTLM